MCDPCCVRTSMGTAWSIGRNHKRPSLKTKDVASSRSRNHIKLVFYPYPPRKLMTSFLRGLKEGVEGGCYIVFFSLKRLQSVALNFKRLSRQEVGVDVKLGSCC